MNEDRFISFSLGEEEFGIPLLSVKEVIAVPEVTPVPQTPAHFLGMMNLRGQVISVVDLRKRLAIEPKEQGETAVIICDLKEVVIGVVVDSVNAVIHPEDGDLSPKPSIESKVKSDHITGVYCRDKRLVLFLDIAKVLDAHDLKAARGAHAAAA